MTVNSSGGGSANNFRAQQFRKLRELPTAEQMDQKLKDVSKLYEKQFLREMVKAMRGTVTEGGFIQANQAEKIFKDQLDNEYVESWGDNGGIGLSEVIYQQLVDRIGPQMGIRPHPQKPHGPLKLDEKSILHQPFKYKMHSDAEKTGKVTVQFDVPSSQEKVASDVTMPWGGSVLGIKKLDLNEFFLDLTHENGMKSQVVFKGSLSDELQKIQGQLQTGSTGEPLEAGQSLGVLGPEAKSLFWTVESSGKKTDATGLE